MPSKLNFKMNIPKLNPQDVIDEVLRMTGLSLEQYCMEVETAGMDYSRLIASEKVNDKVLAEKVAIAITMYPEFWQFFRNQVYLQSLAFIYNWYHIHLCESGMQMNMTAWRNSIKPNRIKARPMFRIFHKCFTIDRPTGNEYKHN